MPSSRQILFLLFGIGLLLRLAFALLPLPVHLVLLEDDAWMVAAISRNWVMGLGITADGLTATNGFHPLYPLTVGALPWLVAPQNLDLAFQLSLGLTAVLNALTVFPLYGLARRFTDAAGALLVVLLFAANPFLIRISVNAMETSLGLLLLTTLWYAYYTLGVSTRRNLLLLTLVTVLAIYARLDAALAFGAIGLSEGVRQLAVVWRTKQLRVPGLWLAYGGLVLGLLLPYLVTNQVVFGSWQPSSSRALAYMHSYAESFTPTVGIHILFGTPALNVTFAGSLLLKLGLLVLVGGLIWLTFKRNEWSVWLPMFLFMLLVILYYGYLLQHNVSRYYVGMAIPIFVAVGVILRRLWLRYPRLFPRVLIVAVVIGMLVTNSLDIFTAYMRGANAPSLTQPTMYETALWIREHVEPSVRIGATDSGIYQYYSGHHVINLDGKLNMDMVPVFEKRTLLPYLESRGITFLVDTQQGLERRFALYDASFGNAPPHLEIGLLEHLQIYAELIARRIGLPVHVELADNTHYVLTRPLEDAMTLIKTFPRPNEATNPVAIYQLR